MHNLTIQSNPLHPVITYMDHMPSRSETMNVLSSAMETTESEVRVELLSATN